MQEGGSEKQQRRSEGMNGQTSQERRRRTPARGQGGLTLRGVGQGLGDQTQDVGGRPHRSLSLFPNFCKQDCCGLARVTHTPLTACSLGLLHLPPWRLGSNLGGGVGGGGGLLSWERPPWPAHASPLRSAGPAPETGTRAVQYSVPSGSGDARSFASIRSHP